MATNFEFLKKIDKNLYTIISEAELLYRDEYFEQCMVQTRRFGESLCKNVLGSKRRGERTFDDMLATLKDNITGEEQEKEFIDDLYFLKKNGNSSAHSTTVKKEGMLALECLQRAFEAAINYCVYFTGASSNILKLQYDTELLITGEKTKKTLAEKYQEEKLKSEKAKKISQKKSSKNKKQDYIPQSYVMKTSKKKNKKPIFWIFTGISLVFSIILLLILAFFI